MVPSRRRHRRRSHHGHRQPVGSDRCHPHRRRRARGRAWVHRPARAVGVQRPGRQPRRQQDHAGHHHRDHRRRGLDRAGERSDAGRRARRPTTSSRSPRTGARWPSTSRGWSGRRSAVNVGTFVGSGGLRDYVIGKDDRPATADEIDEDAGARGRGHAARGARRELVAAVHPEPVLRRTDELVGPGQGGGRTRRHLHHPPALRGQQRDGVARRGDRHRRARRHPGGDLAPQDRVQSQLGQDARGAARASRRREPAACACRPTSIPTIAPRTASTPACRCGRAKAARRRCSSG